MSPDAAFRPLPHTRPLLRLVARPPLRVADVALFYRARSGGIRSYMEAKTAFAAASGAFEHHVVVPRAAERHHGLRHELPAVRIAASNGCVALVETYPPSSPICSA